MQPAALTGCAHGTGHSLQSAVMFQTDQRHQVIGIDALDVVGEQLVESGGQGWVSCTHASATQPVINSKWIMLGTTKLALC